uniref:Uncharacterized protein n=1 Tax=Trichogramma kaykai TaxID=54128 RepID=A0ABD2WQU7_9HYME
MICGSAYLPLIIHRTGRRSEFSGVEEPSKVRECCASEKPKFGVNEEPSEEPDTRVFKAELRDMKSQIDSRLDEIKSQAETQHIELNSKLVQFESSITQLTARVEVQEHKSTESAAALAKMQNEFEEVKVFTEAITSNTTLSSSKSHLVDFSESISDIKQKVLHVSRTVQNIQTAGFSPTPQLLSDDCEVLLSGLPIESNLSDSAILHKTLSNIRLSQHIHFITCTRRRMRD